MASSLGERCLEVAFAERDRGVRAPMSPAKNWSPDIAEYFRCCVRDTNGDGTPDDIGAWLAKAGGNWCAASASWCLLQSMRDGDIEPHLPRAGVVEIEADAKARGLWLPAQSWLQGAEIRPGDLAIWKRPGGEAWWRHVNRVVEAETTGGISLRTIGGNESRRWAVRTHSVPSLLSQLLGFVRYWDPREKCHPLDDAERAALREQIEECTAELMREVVL